MRFTVASHSAFVFLARYLLRPQLLQRLLNQRASLQRWHLLLVGGHPIHAVEIPMGMRSPHW